MKKLSLATLALVSLTFVGCSSDESGLQNINQPKEITFVSNVSMTRSTNINLQKTQIAEGVKVGVFVKNQNGFIAGGNNAQLTANGAGAFTGTPIYFPADGSAVSVTAYAPYSSSWSDMSDVDAEFTVESNQSTDAGYLASDLLHGIPTGTNSFTEANPVVALNFEHKLSKLTVKFKTSEETDVDLKGATVQIVNTLPTTTLKVSDGTLGTATGTAKTIKAATFATDASEFLAGAIIVPQTVAQGSFIQVVLTNGKMLNAKLNSAATFVSGKAYTYSVNISGQGEEAEAVIELNSVVTDWVEDETILTGDVTEEDAPEPEPITLTATFQTPGSNASYSSPTYTWTGSTSNLMTVFEFANGELANYHTLQFTFSNLVDGPVRMGYYVGSTFTEFGNGFYSAGTKTIDLTALGIDLATVTKIAFGGKSGGGSCDIVASDVMLIGNADGESSGGSSSGGGSSDGNSLTATFGTPGGNASYQAPTYTWTGSSNNLMTVFEFANGELANYSTLTFTFSNLVDGPVRMGYYVGSTFTEFGNGYYSAGTKTVDLTTLGIDLSTVTKIAFGGRSNAGSCDINASDVILSK